MNTQTQEALKMAIEQMNVYAHIHLCEHQCQDEELLDAIKACKEALAQPTQEPVLLNVKTHDDKTYKVEVSAPTWQGLSDDEIDKIYFKTFDTWSSEVDVEFSRAIEQALKEKNT